MVEVEELSDDEPTTSTTTPPPPTATTTTTKDGDGWEELMGNDLVMKIIDKSEPAGGKGPEVIQPQDAVLIDFVGRLAQDRSVTDGPIIQQAKSWLVVIGEGDIIPCMELAIRFMETGQTSLVWAHSKYAFGPGTRKYTTTTGGSTGGKETLQIPPHANVLYEIKVTMIVVDTSRLNPYFSIQKATTRKLIANDIYEHEWCLPPKSATDPSCDMAMRRAIRLYYRAAKDMDTLLQGTYFAQVEEDHPQRHQTRQLMLDCWNNIVAVHLRQHEYHLAKDAAVQVLQYDPNNIKALLRAAKAALLDPASTLEEVQAALDAAEQEITYKHPQEEKQFKQLKVQFKQKKQQYKQQTKAMFGDKLKQRNVFASPDDDNNNKDNNSNNSNNNEEEEEEEETARDPKNENDADAVKKTIDDEGKGNTSKGGGGDDAAVEPSKTLKQQRVSFHEPTTKPPSENGTLTKEGGEEKETDVAKENRDFWVKQGMTILIQVIIPLALFFLYRLVLQTNAVGKATLSANEAKVLQVEDMEVLDLDSEIP